MAHRILLTGGSGMLGSALRKLCAEATPHLDLICPTHRELDLLDRDAVKAYLQQGQFEGVIHAAAKVGGIKANMNDHTGFLSENMLMGLYLIEEARLSGIPRLINLGSSCMYPRNYRMPLIEEDLLAAPLEPTNEGYALAKISLAKLCSYVSTQYGMAYKTLIPCNLYGPGDHFDLERGHLVAAALLKVHAAKVENSETVEIWGDGLARREFLYVDDLARFILTSFRNIESFPDCLNVGSGIDHSINEYYEHVRDVVGYRGLFTHNTDKPVGMTQKLMDSSKAKQFGWSPSTSLAAGLRMTYERFTKDLSSVCAAAAE